MNEIEDDILPRFEVSCTKEVAVAKMLGWLQGPIRKRIIYISKYGISADQMPHLPELEYPLEKHLMDIREEALDIYIQAIGDDAPEDVIREKEGEVIECNKLIKLAAAFFEDIGDEITKGNTSALRIDQEATCKSGITHITLKSLKVWALSEYGISIDQCSAQETAINVPQLQQKYPAEEIQQIEDQSNQEEDWPSQIKAKTFKITMAFLIDAFAKTNKDFLKRDGSPNMHAIAEHLENLAKKANDDNPVLGQSSETIRRILAESIGTRKLTLHEKKQ